MPVYTSSMELSTRGGSEVIDITGQVQERLSYSGMREGLVTVFVPGSTGGVITLECEPGLVRDLGDALERLAPREKTFHHDRTWGDGNGHSHVRASLVGPSLSVPFREGRLVLGTWQQIAFIDFDNRPRRRVLIIQVMGD